MPETPSRRKAWLRQAGLYLLLGLLFALTYTQSPLYTSNQNQYFLHGMARAGFGYLKQDWLANTLDPTPLFSAIVYLTYRITHQPLLFYLYYAILLGVYLFCLIGIADFLFDLCKSKTRLGLFLGLVFLVHSAALRFALSRTLGENWTYILEDGLADQRLLGPVFQPSAFGVLLVLSIYLFLKNKPILAVLAAALAATIHPTYLLGAAALTLAYMADSYRKEHRLSKILLIGATALLAVSPILVYVYSSFANTPPGPSAKAQEILVTYRIPFHAVVGRWFDLTAVVKILLVIWALWLIRKSRLFLILIIPTGIAFLLTVVQVLTHSNTLALLFPWRVSTFVVPLCVTLLLAASVTGLFERYPNWNTPGKKWMLVVSALLIGLSTLIGGARLVLDFQRQAADQDRAMMAFVGAHHSPDQYYLTPLDMQDFRLVTGSPVYVEFKSIPYQARDVLEWVRRIQNTDQFYKKADCAWIEKLHNIGLTHVIATPKLYNLECSDWTAIYQDQHYGVYVLNQSP